MKTIRVGLLGNPDCGKSTLFNALTGSRQHVGNWPGVTVERKSGYFSLSDYHIELIDLPGIYSLISVEETTAIDERIACKTILSGELDLIINIVDATNLERNLYLTTQLLEMRKPVIVAMNMMDVAEKRHIQVDLAVLSTALHCPVVGLSSTKKTGLSTLKQQIVTSAQRVQITQGVVQYPTALTYAIQHITQIIEQHYPAQKQIAPCLALRLLEGDKNDLTQALTPIIMQQQTNIEKALQEEPDILIADARYSFIHELCKKILLAKSHAETTFTQWLDRMVLHRLVGIPIFLLIMYMMFFFAINMSGAFQKFFDISSDTIFVQGLAYWLQQAGLPAWFVAVMAAGVGKGINTTLTFIPVIGSLFLFLAFLEGSGYMARAAFVMDRLMRAVGLPGKSFVPMIVGFGCNVPAIMATRTLENKRDRILTILMSPFMSCGARLAIYAVFTAAFFPQGGQNVVSVLYLLGILMAIMTGLIIRKTLLKGEPSPLIMELPPYHIPTLSAICKQTWIRLKAFVFKAGCLIIPICMLMGALNALDMHGALIKENNEQNSILSTIGKTVTPVFAPMGIHQQNWPATVGLLSGVLAKEVVVGTLNTLYTQAGNLTIVKPSEFNFRQGLKDAVQSIPQGLADLKHSFSNPVLASAPDHAMNQGVFGIMYIFFGGQVGAFAYLLFVLLYFPCVSATAAMTRELNKGWTLFAVLWTTGLAYATAVIFYQAATWTHHPLTSSAWIVGLLMLFLSVLFIMRQYANNKIKPVIKQKHYATN